MSNQEHPSYFEAAAALIEVLQHRERLSKAVSRLAELQDASAGSEEIQAAIADVERINEEFAVLDRRHRAVFDYAQKHPDGP